MPINKSPAALTVKEPRGLQLLLPVRSGEEYGGKVADGELLPGLYVLLAEHLHLQTVSHHHASVGSTRVIPGVQNIFIDCEKCS